VANTYNKGEKGREKEVKWDDGRGMKQNEGEGEESCLSLGGKISRRGTYWRTAWGMELLLQLG
jgi:hypothetical protein